MASQIKPFTRKKRKRSAAIFQPASFHTPFQPFSLSKLRYFLIIKKQAYKPDSVSELLQSLIIYLTLPTHRDRTSSPQAPAYLALQSARFTKPHAVASVAVSSYLAFSPLPRQGVAVYFLWHSLSKSGFPNLSPSITGVRCSILSGLSSPR